MSRTPPPRSSRPGRRQDRDDAPKLTEEHEGLPGYLEEPPLLDDEPDAAEEAP